MQKIEGIRNNLKKITDLLQKEKGNSYGELCEDTKKKLLSTSRKMITEKMTMNRILATANKIHNMNHNLPNILKTVYDEDRER